MRRMPSNCLKTRPQAERKGPRIGVLVTMGFESGLRLSRGRGYGEGLPRHLQVDPDRTPGATSALAAASSLAKYVRWLSGLSKALT